MTALSAALVVVALVAWDAWRRTLAVRDVERRALAAEARAARMVEEIYTLGKRVSALEERTSEVVTVSDAMAEYRKRIEALEAADRLRSMSRPRA